MTPQPSIALHPAARARNMITIASGKGGVGKTLLAICIAQAFSKASQTTLLFDGDFGLANVDIQLGLMPEHDLGSVITGRIAIDEAVTRFEDGGFDILAGKSGSGASAQLSKERLEMVRKALMGIAASYDRVVVDLGAGIHNDARMLAASSGTVLVIATDEPTSLTDAYAFIKVTNAQYPGTDIRILVNMAQSAGKENPRTKRCARPAKVRVVAVGATVQAMITTIGAKPQAPPVAAELALASLGDGTKMSPGRPWPSVPKSTPSSSPCRPKPLRQLRRHPHLLSPPAIPFRRASPR